MNSSSMTAGFHLGSPIPISDPDPTSHHRHFLHSMPPPPPPPPNPIALSDDDEDDAAKTKKGSPWHRVKWDDTMVSLLISIVGLVEADGAPEVATPQRRPVGALQKKGKWKAASKLMLDKGGYSVSPQQCEDKFNDLNKRYKRLNEILGRGTTCQVVENPALLDAMPHIPLKAKDDVRKILASKHLFYREMCAYHNRPRAAAPSASHEHEYHDHDTPNFDDSAEDDDEDEGNAGFGSRSYGSFRAEMDVVFHDKAKSPAEKLDWLLEREVKIQEERVAIEVEALDLEKERLRWQKYRNNKDREMERMRLQNERLRLENERLVIQMKMKMRETELEHKRPGESMESTGGFRLERDQRRDPMDLI